MTASICIMWTETLEENAMVQYKDRQAMAVIKGVMSCYRKLTVHIEQSNGTEHAQVCAGGIPLEEVSEHLESLKQKGLYLAGELLDVDGKCGGYNLQFAWTSGVIAGRSAARRQ